MSTPQLSPGTVIESRFTVGQAVRKREGATVYDATDPQSGPCSITLYDASCFPSGLVLERSLRELRQLQSVVSPRVVPVIAAGKFGDGIYEATGKLPPQTLTETLASGPLSLRDAAGLIVQVGEALLEAQRAGVIHRDLGGDVVFPSPEGVRVTGFAVGEPQGPGSFGALACIAPEQVEGKVVDQRTLIYNVAALMHWMLAGSPLFEGDRGGVLALHATGDPPSSVHAKLRRALGKDPRMRPMMLKQFLGELASMGGVEPPRAAPRPAAPPMPAAAPRPAPPPAAPPAAPAAKPSSRGWTMFMKAQDDEGEAPPSEPASTPVPPGGEASPSTRGWTMFMKEEDAAQPRPATAAEMPTAPQPPAGDKPSTRGWTMFMKAEDEGAVEAAPPPPAADKPSTRGWTMFMKEGEEGDASSGGAPAAAPVPPPVAAPAAPTPPSRPAMSPPVGSRPAAPPPAAASRAPAPATPPSSPARTVAAPSRAPVEPPSPAAAAGEPTTRGWTMFMKEEGEQQPPTDTSPAGVPEPAMPPAEGDPSAPSSRGWTMFTDPGSGGVQVGPPSATAKGRTEMATAPFADRAASAPAERPEPRATESSDQHLAAEGQKKRGWTMFMDAPISDLAQKAPPPEAEPPQVGASDKKGWTVFGEPSPTIGSPSAPEPSSRHPPSVDTAAVSGSEAPDRGRTVMYTGTPPAPPPYGSFEDDTPPPSSAPSAAELARAAAASMGNASQQQSAKTVVAQGMPVQSGPGGGVTGRAMVPGAQPDTMYFKRGQTEPEKPSARSPTARDLEPAAAMRPAEERAPRAADFSSSPSVHPGAHPPAVASGGGAKVVYIVVGVVAFLAIGTAAFFAFT